MSAVLDTNESKRRHRDAIRYVDPIFDVTDDRRRGFVYTCPRCGWHASPKKWRVGAEWAGDRHALDCPAACRG